MIQTFDMIRDVDATGNSGTGVVAEAVTFKDGTTIVHWSASTNAMGTTSTVIYSSLEDAIKVHGHGGLTRFERTNKLPEPPPTSPEAKAYYDDIRARGGAV